MKNHLLVVFFNCISIALVGQVHEVGGFIGGTNYVGDIGRTNYIYPNTPAGAIIYKWNWNPRIALRATYSYLPITGNDKNADTDFKVNRGIEFSNTIHELAVGMEYNFYEYDLSSDDKFSTPYILLELAAFNYKSPLVETAPNQYLFTNKTSYTIPFGVGYKSRLYGAFAFAIEAKFSYTFEDDLDYSTGRIPSLNYGGKGNDWYMFTGISLVYTFGRQACYKNGL
jgi:hypothetical protein